MASSSAAANGVIPRTSRMSLIFLGWIVFAESSPASGKHRSVRTFWAARGVVFRAIVIFPMILSVSRVLTRAFENALQSPLDQATSAFGVLTPDFDFF